MNIYKLRIYPSTSSTRFDHLLRKCTKTSTFICRVRIRPCFSSSDLYVATHSLSRIPGELYGKLSDRHFRMFWERNALRVLSSYQNLKILVNQVSKFATRRLAESVIRPGCFEKSLMSLFKPRAIPSRTALGNSEICPA